jgi:zinc-ribbon domain
MTSCPSCGSGVLETDLYCRNCGTDLNEANTKLVRKGRTLVFVVILLLAPDVLLTMISDFSLGNIVRGTGEIVLLYLVFHGYSWARWLLGFLLIFASILSLVLLDESLIDQSSTFMIAIEIIIFCIITSAAALLLIPQSVRVFQQAQRESRRRRASL